MGAARSFFVELRRRNVLRAAVLYVGAVWALAQGIAQLGPSFGAPEWITRGFVIAAAVGFPFWLVFAWIYEFTPQGIKRESEVAPGESITHRTGRKLDFAIIAVLAVAVLLLLGNQFVWHKGILQGSPALTMAAAMIPQKSVAVLPFANESGKQDERFFSDGLSDDLINALSQFDGLKVISRNSAFQFRDSKDTAAKIGQLLGVAHLLEGSVQRAGDEVRITATLVNAAEGSIAWSQRYDRPYTDLFALQDEITTAVADALKAKLLSAPGIVVQSDRPPGGNIDAYMAYQHGIAYAALNTEASLHQAIDAFSEAVRLDPKYAAAYARFSNTWANLAAQFLGGAQAAQAYANARKAAATALTLDPGSALAHQARAYVLLNADMDWRGAEAEYRQTLQLAPNSAGAQFALSNTLAVLGQVRQAVGLIRKALVGDPRHAQWYYWLSAYLSAAGQPDAARQAIGTAIALQPGASTIHEQLAIVEILRGDAKAALAAAQAEPAGPWHDVAMALALQIGPDRAAADAALKALLAKYSEVAPYQIAEVYALRRDPDNTFKWLDRAWAGHDPGVQSLLYDPFILRYKDDPRFAAFARKVGLPTTTDAVAMK
ncbi:MAG: hypothetical protein JSS21_00950 [Proteobacteria bacterium]|nr:hypothetical protein [Pseudomonadota bacterium]